MNMTTRMTNLNLTRPILKFLIQSSFAHMPILPLTPCWRGSSVPVSIRFVSGKVATSGVYKSTISMNSSKHTERVVNTMTSQEAYKNATMNSENCGENCQSWWTMIRCHKRKEYSCVSADIALRFSNELTLNLGNKQAKELALQKRRDSLSRKEYVLRQKITRDILMRADVASIIVAFSSFVSSTRPSLHQSHTCLSTACPLTAHGGH